MDAKWRNLKNPLRNVTVQFLQGRVKCKETLESAKKEGDLNANEKCAECKSLGGKLLKLGKKEMCSQEHNRVPATRKLTHAQARRTAERLVSFE